MGRRRPGRRPGPYGGAPGPRRPPAPRPGPRGRRLGARRRLPPRRRPDAVDLHRFERLAAEGAAALAAGEAERAAALLDEALGLWRGPALADLPGRDTDPWPYGSNSGTPRRGATGSPPTWPSGGPPPPSRRSPRSPPGSPRRTPPGPADPRPARGRTARRGPRGVRGGARVLADRLGTDPGLELRSLHAELLTEDGPRPRAPERPARPPDLVHRPGRRTGSLAAAWGGRRLVTLTGPGGVGKTRLALEAAGTYEGPVHLAELASVREESTVAAAVLTALGARETQLWHTPSVVPADPKDRFAALVEHCAGRRMLLVLDNCEHVVAEAAELAQTLLTRCPGVTVLATSREPLGVPGRRSGRWARCPWTWRPAPRGAWRGRPPRIRHGAGPGGGGGGLPPPRRTAAGDRTGAARLRMLSVRQIADRLDDRFRLLTSGARTVLPRQQTLRAVVDWSWELSTRPSGRSCGASRPSPAAAT
ncbi:BTAD domain-containing putative transcriptional regulator [Streptomyces diastatochromogenes]|nr:BTAD domain-containing putative transcriptional regulator [Streptomyces diastatochromogenes]